MNTLKELENLREHIKQEIDEYEIQIRIIQTMIEVSRTHKYKLENIIDEIKSSQVQHESE